MNAFQEIIEKGIASCLKARKSWERTPLEKRAEVFYNAAELMRNKYRYDLLATTMLGQVEMGVRVIEHFTGLVQNCFIH